MLKKAVSCFTCLGLFLLTIPSFAVEDVYDMTSVFYRSASKGNREQIRTLILNGYNIDEPNLDGNTALCLAAQQKNKLAYETLLKMGASPKADCMVAIKNQEIAQRPQKMIYLNGGLSESTYGRQELSDPDGIFWTAQNKVLAGLLVAGGAGAALALSGGGGGGGSGGSSSAQDILSAEVPACLGGHWSYNNEVYTCVCPAGTTLKYGACVENKDSYQTNDVSNDTTIELTSASDTLTAELGASATNNGTITGTSFGSDLVAMQVSGFSSDSNWENMTPDTKLNPSSASMAYNNGTITLSHNTSTSTDALYGIQALSGANAENNDSGVITLNAQASGSVYGLYAQNIDYGLQNKGAINLNLSQNALTAYGLYTEERSSVNTGTITTTITNPVFQQNLSGVVAGMYANSQQNSGSILLRRGETSGTITESNLNFYGMYVRNNGSAENLENGLISLDVSGTPFYSYGIFAEQGTTGITNKGRIEIFGNLASKESTAGVGGAYGIRFIGGTGSIVNEGEIETRHYNTDTQAYENLAIVGDAYLSLIKGFNGTVHNKTDLYMMIDNKVPVGTSAGWTLAAIDLQNDSSNSETSLLNDADLYITINNIEGYNTSAKENSRVYGLYTGFASVQNNGDITIISPVDYLDVYGAYGYTTINSQYSLINITGSGSSSSLFGVGGDVNASQYNLGTIEITHNSSGSMLGVGGSNDGTIILKSIPNLDVLTSMIATGIQTGTNNGQINISMQKGSYGEAIGFAATVLETADESLNLSNTGTLSIVYENRTLPEIGIAAGMLYENEKTTTLSINNSGLISIDALTNIEESSPLVAENISGIIAMASDTSKDHSFNVTNSLGGKIDLQFNGSGSIVGMENNSSIVIDSEHKPEMYAITNNGTIRINAINTQTGSLTRNNLSATYSNNDTTISIVPESTTTTIPFNIVGMMTNSVAINNGDILFEVSGNAKVAGMVAYDGGVAINGPGGFIEFRGNSSNFTAMYGTGKRTIIEETQTQTTSVENDHTIITRDTTTATTEQYSTIINYGTIKINEIQYDRSDSSDYLLDIENHAKVARVDSSHANEITTTVTTEEESRNGGISWTTLNSSTDVNDDNYTTPLRDSDTSSLTITTLNQGVNYVSEQGGVFSAENTHIVGDVLAGVSLTQQGNLNTYIGSGTGEGAVIGDGNADDLGLASMSAMFDASWATNTQNANGLDIVMTKKDFAEITDNKSLANFLEKNYALGNNQDFFNDLKAISDVANFNRTLNTLTGVETLSRFAYEDLTAMRELNFEMNQVMFTNADKPLLTTQGTLNGFSFKNNSATNASYALSSKKISPRWRVGYAMSKTDLATDDKADTTRKNQIFQVFAPIGYDHQGLKLISTPQLAYMRSNYTRSGYEGGAYEGVIEKRVFGFMNEARYSVHAGDIEFAPTLELNAIAYSQKGKEDTKTYALRIPTDTNISIEAGLGLHANKQLEIGFNGKLNLDAGMMVYREFAEPYDIKLGMQGMSGTFDLYDRHSDYRAVASFGFNYEVGAVNMYGSVQHFMETDAHTVAKTGIKIGF